MAESEKCCGGTLFHEGYMGILDWWRQVAIIPYAKKSEPLE